MKFIKNAYLAYRFNPYWLGSNRRADQFDIDIVHIRFLLLILVCQTLSIYFWPKLEEQTSTARYIYTDANGTPLKPKPLDEPLPEEDVLKFGKKAIERGFTFDSKNLRNRVFNASNRYFNLDWRDVEGTQGGEFSAVPIQGIKRLENRRVFPGQELMVLVYRSGMFKAVMEENTAFTTLVGDGEITAHGAFDMGGYEQYQWLVNYPATLLRYDNHQKPAKQLKVNFLVKIVRVGTSASNEYLLVERIQMSIGDKRV